MSIPSAIINSLSQFSSHESFEEAVLIERNKVDARNRICLVLMSDELGRAQVLFAADRMLNVDELNDAMGRSFSVIKQSDQQSLLDKYALQAMPAIPDITGIPSIIDESIFASSDDYIYVDAGNPDHFVQIKRAIFESLLVKGQRSQFTRAIADIPLHDQSSNDQNEIHQAIEKFTTLRIKQRIEDTLELPPLPQSAREIIQLRADPDASSEELSSIVEKDPSLSAQVVSWASSSFYSAPGSVKSVHDAIVRVLGFDLVMNLSMGLSLGRTLNLPQDEPEGYMSYWKKALWMALGTTALLTKVPSSLRPSFGMAYLSGLLHNFGYLVLAHVFPPHQSLICRYREANPHMDASLIEAHCLDITSEQMGAMLMHTWDIPPQVVTALRHQKHAEFDGENCQYAKILLLTQYTLEKKGILPRTIEQTPQSVLDYFNIDETTALSALDGLLETPDEIDQMAGMLSS